MRSFKLLPAILWAASILFSLTLAGCGNSSKSTSATSPQNAEPVKSTAAKTGQMPSEEECRQWAARLERAAIDGDVRAFNEKINFDAMLEATTGGISGAENMRNHFIEGVKIDLDGKNGLASKLLQQVAMGGSYTFLRTALVDKQKRVYFRFLPPDGGINYHEWILIRSPTGKVQAIDVYFYLSAERMSKTLRRGYLPLVASQSRSVLSKLTSGESEFIETLPKREAMLNAIQSGNFNQANSIYDSLPPLTKKDKSILILRLQATMASGNDAVYLAAMEDFRKFHPNDPCLDLISIDHHIMSKNYAQAINCIERLDKSVGGDPYLLFMKGSIHSIKEDYQAARHLMREAIQAEPTLVDPYWGLVDVSLSEKDFDETNRLLDHLEQHFQIIFDDFTQIPEYAEYVKSPQYQQWLKKQNTNRH